MQRHSAAVEAAGFSTVTDHQAQLPYLLGANEVDEFSTTPPLDAGLDCDPEPAGKNFGSGDLPQSPHLSSMKLPDSKYHTYNAKKGASACHVAEAATHIRIQDSKRSATGCVTKSNPHLQTKLIAVVSPGRNKRNTSTERMTHISLLAEEAHLRLGPNELAAQADREMRTRPGAARSPKTRPRTSVPLCRSKKYILVSQNSASISGGAIGAGAAPIQIDPLPSDRSGEESASPSVGGCDKMAQRNSIFQQKSKKSSAKNSKHSQFAKNGPGLDTFIPEISPRSLGGATQQPVASPVTLNLDLAQVRASGSTGSPTQHPAITISTGQGEEPKKQAQLTEDFQQATNQPPESNISMDRLITSHQTTIIKTSPRQMLLMDQLASKRNQTQGQKQLNPPNQLTNAIASPPVDSKNRSQTRYSQQKSVPSCTNLNQSQQNNRASLNTSFNRFESPSRIINAPGDGAISLEEETRLSILNQPACAVETSNMYSADKKPLLGSMGDYNDIVKRRVYEDKVFKQLQNASVQSNLVGGPGSLAAAQQHLANKNQQNLFTLTSEGLQQLMLRNSMNGTTSGSARFAENTGRGVQAHNEDNFKVQIKAYSAGLERELAARRQARQIRMPHEPLQQLEVRPTLVDICDDERIDEAFASAQAQYLAIMRDSTAKPNKLQVGSTSTEALAKQRVLSAQNHGNRKPLSAGFNRARKLQVQSKALEASTQRQSQQQDAQRVMPVSCIYFRPEDTKVKAQLGQPIQLNYHAMLMDLNPTQEQIDEEEVNFQFDQQNQEMISQVAHSLVQTPDHADDQVIRSSQQFQRQSTGQNRTQFYLSQQQINQQATQTPHLDESQLIAAASEVGNFTGREWAILQQLEHADQAQNQQQAQLALGHSAMPDQNLTRVMQSNSGQQQHYFVLRQSEPEQDKPTLNSAITSGMHLEQQKQLISPNEMSTNRASATDRQDKVGSAFPPSLKLNKEQMRTSLRVQHDRQLREIVDNSLPARQSASASSAAGNANRSSRRKQTSTGEQANPQVQTTLSSNQQNSDLYHVSTRLREEGGRISTSSQVQTPADPITAGAFDVNPLNQSGIVPHSDAEESEAKIFSLQQASDETVSASKEVGGPVLNKNPQGFADYPTQQAQKWNSQHLDEELANLHQQIQCDYHRNQEAVMMDPGSQQALSHKASDGLESSTHRRSVLIKHTPLEQLSTHEEGNATGNSQTPVPPESDIEQQCQTQSPILVHDSAKQVQTKPKSKQGAINRSSGPQQNYETAPTHQQEPDPSLVRLEHMTSNFSGAQHPHQSRFRDQRLTGQPDVSQDVRSTAGVSARRRVSQPQQNHSRPTFTQNIKQLAKLMDRQTPAQNRQLTRKFAGEINAKPTRHVNSQLPQLAANNAPNQSAISTNRQSAVPVGTSAANQTSLYIMSSSGAAAGTTNQLDDQTAQVQVDSDDFTDAGALEEAEEGQTIDQAALARQNCYWVKSLPGQYQRESGAQTQRLNVSKMRGTSSAQSKNSQSHPLAYMCRPNKPNTTTVLQTNQLTSTGAQSTQMLGFTVRTNRMAFASGQRGQQIQQLIRKRPLTTKQQSTKLAEGIHPNIRPFDCLLQSQGQLEQIRAEDTQIDAKQAQSSAQANQLYRVRDSDLSLAFMTSATAASWDATSARHPQLMNPSKFNTQPFSGLSSGKQCNAPMPKRKVAANQREAQNLELQQQEALQKQIHGDKTTFFAQSRAQRIKKIAVESVGSPIAGSNLFCY